MSYFLQRIDKHYDDEMYRLYDEYYSHERDDDDDDDWIVESERQIHEFVVNMTKAGWARHGKSMPQDFLNPFELFDE